MNHSRVECRASPNVAELAAGQRVEVRTAVGKNAAHVLLVSTYELGHQPFGLAEPAAMLRERGAVVRTVDLAVECLDEDVFRGAASSPFTSNAHRHPSGGANDSKSAKLEPHRTYCGVRAVCADERDLLRHLGVQTVLGGEFEEDLPPWPNASSAASKQARRTV